MRRRQGTSGGLEREIVEVEVVSLMVDSAVDGLFW